MQFGAKKINFFFVAWKFLFIEKTKENNFYSEKLLVESKVEF